MYYDYEDCEPDNPFEEEFKAMRDHGADHLSAIYAMLSGAEKIDVRELYNHLEEVSSTLGFDMPYKPEHEDYLHSLLV